MFIPKEEHPNRTEQSQIKVDHSPPRNITERIRTLQKALYILQGVNSLLHKQGENT